MNFLTKALISLCLAVSVANADTIIVPLKGVYDGDTVFTELCGLPQSLKKISVRLVNIDTPEIRTTCAYEKAMGYAAKKFLEDTLAGQTEIMVKDVEWDKYGGRIDGDIILPDGRSVSDIMVANGYAKPYTGGAREPWCDK